MPPGTSLIDLLSQKQQTPISGCHDALSAIVAQRAGFPLLWASSLGLSAVQGRRDAGELSWSEVVTLSSNITNVTDIPLLVDGDNGHGDFNIARLFATQLRKVGVAGVSIEDQAFPKCNSLIEAGQELEDRSVFCGKIAAVKDALGKDFIVVARIEALVVGKGLACALDRAYAYTEAGADAIIIHSKSADAADIVRFVQQWDRPHPIILIPTAYYASLLQHLPGLRVGGIVWANQLLRAQVRALQAMASALLNAQNPEAAPPLASIEEVFALVGLDRLPAEERIYGKRVV
ncbi:MAG TPA: isocitrate lyase/phosphoenolpyruvate mutase family protein [Ktedonobacteraceae bacterium]|jgi:phosphoenolpyruvate phosphomutase